MIKAIEYRSDSCAPWIQKLNTRTGEYCRYLSVGNIVDMLEGKQIGENKFQTILPNYPAKNDLIDSIICRIPKQDDVYISMKKYDDDYNLRTGKLKYMEPVDVINMIKKFKYDKNQPKIIYE